MHPRRQDKEPPPVAALLIAHAPCPGGEFPQRILLLTNGRVIVEYLLALPPQHAPARPDQQPGRHQDGKPCPPGRQQHAPPVLLHGRAHALLVGADGVADSLRTCAQFRSDRLLVLAECGFQHLAGTLLLRFRFLL
ncbi:hypothetical protein D3C81_1857550 [compost metagenome]